MKLYVNTCTYIGDPYSKRRRIASMVASNRDDWGAHFQIHFSSNSKWKIYEQFKNSEIYYANE
jgi:hypothetical protein